MDALQKTMETQVQVDIELDRLTSKGMGAPKSEKTLLLDNPSALQTQESKDDDMSAGQRESHASIASRKETERSRA